MHCPSMSSYISIAAIPAAPNANPPAPIRELAAELAVDGVAAAPAALEVEEAVLAAETPPLERVVVGLLPLTASLESRGQQDFAAQDARSFARCSFEDPFDPACQVSESQRNRKRRRTPQ